MSVTKSGGILSVCKAELGLTGEERIEMRRKKFKEKRKEKKKRRKERKLTVEEDDEDENFHLPSRSAIPFDFNTIFDKLLKVSTIFLVMLLTYLFLFCIQTYVNNDDYF